MMTVYLSSPMTQLQAEHCAGMPVLLSFALHAKDDWLHKGYQQSFARVLIDSGAYSELNSGKKVDVQAYAEWSEKWRITADAIAGLDDIAGDWQRSLRNYQAMPDGLGFPTFHDSDPPELLDDLVPIARARGGWIGIGLAPPRSGKEAFVRRTCDRIPDDLHVHGWALRAYSHVRRLDSFDSTHWFRNALKLRTLPDTRHLTYAECLEIVVKRYQRETRSVVSAPTAEATLFDKED